MEFTAIGERKRNLDSFQQKQMKQVGHKVCELLADSFVLFFLHTKDTLFRAFIYIETFRGRVGGKEL